MKVYTVIHYDDAVHTQTVDTFSSFKKALNYINDQLNGIDVITIRPKMCEYWKKKFFYKENYSNIDWSYMLLKQNKIENTIYSKKGKNGYCIDSFGIKVINVK